MPQDAPVIPQPRLGLSRADEAFDRVVRLVRRQLDVAVATVSLVAPGGVVLPGALGMPEPYQTTRRVRIDDSITRRVVESGKPLVLADVSQDPRAATVCALFGAAAGAVAALPVLAGDDKPVGALVAIDTRPRSWTEGDLATLSDLAASCSGEIRLRTERERAKAAERAARKAQRRSQLLLSLSEAFADATSAVQVEQAILRVVRSGMGAHSCALALVDHERRDITFVSAGVDVAPAGKRPRSAAPVRSRTTDNLPVPEVARTGKPLFFSSGAELSARYPHLAGRLDHDGACSVLPVQAHGRVVAVVVTRWDSERAHDKDTASLQSTLAPYVAHALDRVALLEARRHVATTLQEALLTDPPAVANLDIATTYAPATRTDQVGGDWYDVVVVDDDTTVLMIGDVTGHDMQAAARMGQLRSMLRALAWSHDESPSALLTLLDRANHQLGPDAGATAVVVRLERQAPGGSGIVLEPGSYVLTWANAGHPPPLVLRQGGFVERLQAVPDLLLGVAPSTQRHDHTTILRPGETLLLYTDGLVEARGSLLKDRITLLADALAATRDAATATLPGALVRRLVATPQRDDVAVLAVRARVAAPTAAVPAVRPPTPGSSPGTPPAQDGIVRAERRVANSLSDLGPARRWVDDMLETSGVEVRERRTAMLLSSELLTNALEHAGGRVSVMVEISAGWFRVGVRDASTDLPQMKDPEPHELSGRGVQFLDRLATRWGVDDHDGTEIVGRHGTDVAGKTVWFEMGERPAGRVSGSRRSV
ncbi:SpoIIE family protein phosphatase [Xylanimonas oleitrophica]|nr:SpoIIE family protein phosphatase [Xylanimonas oleitrophica]